MDLMLTKEEELLRNVKVRSSLGCSNHKMVEFRILRGRRKAKSRITILVFRRAVWPVQRAA